MEYGIRIGDFAFRTPENFSREFYESVLLREYRETRDPLFYMNVLCASDRIFFNGITEKQYYRLAEKLYNFGKERGIPPEEITPIKSPEWYSRPRPGSPTLDKVLEWMEAERTEKPRAFYYEDAFPEPSKFLFEGETREHMTIRLLRRMKCKKIKGRTPSQISRHLFEDGVEKFVRGLYSTIVLDGESQRKRTIFEPEKKLNINGTLSLASDESCKTDVNFTGTYEKAFRLFNEVLVERVNYNLGKK